MKYIKMFENFESIKVEILGAGDLDRALDIDGQKWFNSYENTEEEGNKYYNMYYSKFGNFYLVTIGSEVYLGQKRENENKYVFFDINDEQLTIEDICSDNNISKEELLSKLN